jgi:hypothetical protein
MENQNQNKKRKREVETKEEKMENLIQMKQHYRYMGIDLDEYYDKLIQHIKDNY